MSQLFKVSFLEPIKLGDDVYSPGYGFTAPAEQFFGPYYIRELAPLNLFKEELFEEISRGYYKITRDLILNVGSVTLRKGDRFYGLPQESGTLGLVTFSEDAVGDYVMHIASVSMTSDTALIEPGQITVVGLTFMDGTKPVKVTGADLTPVDEAAGKYSLQVTAPLKPGVLSLTVVFKAGDTNYAYPLLLNVKSPAVTFVQSTRSMLGGQTLGIAFTVDVAGTKPDLKLVSATADGGGIVKDLVEIDKSKGEWQLFVTAAVVAATMNVKATFDLGGWTYPVAFPISVTTKETATELQGSVLDINLTQLVRMKIVLEGKPVTNLTTKSLVASGSRSYNTYTKKLVKVDDQGTWQWSVYTNSTEGPMYFDITITVDGVDYVLPQQTIIVRKGG